MSYVNDLNIIFLYAEGLKVIYLHTILDINECLSGDHTCDHVCTNSPGSFVCTCNDNYELGDDRKTCFSEFVIT